MTKKELEQIRKIKLILDEGWDRHMMAHKSSAVIDAHQRINLLVEESTSEKTTS